MQRYNDDLIIIINFIVSLNFQENTFQVALATDGTISLVYFIYSDIEWGEFSNMGFRNANGTRVFMLPGALTEETLEIELTSNVDRPGLYIFQVDGMQT